MVIELFLVLYSPMLWLCCNVIVCCVVTFLMKSEVLWERDGRPKKNAITCT